MEFSSCRSFSFITRHGWNWVPFWSCFRASGTSTLLILWSCRGFGFLVCTYGHSLPNLGSFVLGTSTMKRTPVLKYFLKNKFFTASETHSPKFCFRTRNSWLLSLSGTPPLSLLLMPERTILLPFEHEPFAIHCRQSVTFPFRGTAGDGAADTARSP